MGRYFNHYQCDHLKRTAADEPPRRWTYAAPKDAMDMCPTCGIRVMPESSTGEIASDAPTGKDQSELPPDPDSMNHLRAEAARSAVEHFSAIQKTRDEDFDARLIDLLCDLRHLCDREGLRYDQVNERAGRMYREETEAIAEGANA